MSIMSIFDLPDHINVHQIITEKEDERYFEPSKFDAKELKIDYLSEKLAPSLGTLIKDSVILMDETLKAMIAIAHLEDRSWNNLMRTLEGNRLIKPMDEGTMVKDQLTKRSLDVFKFSGSPDPKVVQEVEGWFNRLIVDEDVRNATPIDIKDLANIVAQSGATVTDYLKGLVKIERHLKTAVDSGVVRYPDLDHPYFKVYRIKLTAWSESDRMLVGENNWNGIIGEFNLRRYVPMETIKDMRAEARAKAVKEAENLFDN